MATEEFRRYLAGEITSADYVRLSRERVAEEVRREFGRKRTSGPGWFQTDEARALAEKLADSLRPGPHGDPIVSVRGAGFDVTGTKSDALFRVTVHQFVNGPETTDG